MKQRHIATAIATALKDTPVVLVNGARQTGKTTLVKGLARKRKATYFTLDDHGTLDAALNDPAGFVASLGDFAVVDEVQNAPNIFRAIKASVDRDRRPGRFLLTGSANVLALPRMGDSLAGRMEIITLHPFAQDELAGRRSTFIDTLYKARLPMAYTGTADRAALARRAFAGGYPEVRTRKSPARRAAWYKAYITTILQKDVRDISNIADLTTLPKLLAQLALRSGNLLNMADVARDLDVP
ncbi:MAG: ATP-binding protein, partial [Bacteroidetes bacterium]|nr:ATP-binding protein [Bacteroidota bacterium]